MPSDKSKNVHDGHRQRLRESASRDAELNSFSDFTVLEYLLSFLIPRKDTNVIAHELIESFGNLFGVLTATPNELYGIKNMTQNASHLLPAIFPIVRKAEMSRVSRKRQVLKTDQALEILRPYFLGRNSEYFYMLMLDINNRIISVELISQGIGNFTAVELNIILAKVSRTHACKIILAHNHPGGNVEPSQEDIAATENISMIITGTGREIIDHLIFAGNDYYSFFNNDKLNRVIEATDKIYKLSRHDIVKNRRAPNQYVLEPHIEVEED